LAWTVNYNIPILWHSSDGAQPGLGSTTELLKQGGCALAV